MFTFFRVICLIFADEHLEADERDDESGILGVCLSILIELNLLLYLALKYLTSICLSSMFAPLFCYNFESDTCLILQMKSLKPMRLGVLQIR